MKALGRINLNETALNYIKRSPERCVSIISKSHKSQTRHAVGQTSIKGSYFKIQALLTVRERSMCVQGDPIRRVRIE